MPQHYTDPTRAGDPHALPNVETFYVSDPGELASFYSEEEPAEVGWYWWSCFPGCMPDSDPVGPFATEAEALADAREGTGL